MSITSPLVESAPASEPIPVAPISTDELRAAFKGQVEPVPVTKLYKLGLVIVGLSMLLIPLAYLLLIIALPLGAYYLGMQGIELLKNGDSAKAIGLHFLPAFCSPFFLLFLLKPLFLRPANYVQPTRLYRENEPVLFDFVGHICEILKAPKPEQIVVTLDVNASAGFIGFWGLLTKQLELTFGLPLVAGLDTRQFANVVAHELGHFSQGMAMRMNHIILTINMRLEYMVYGRDRLDAIMSRISRSDEGIMVVLVQPIRFSIWLTRRVLWLFLAFGHAMSCFMARHMEYDADRCAARIAGSNRFRETMDQLHFLQLSRDAAIDTIAHAWEERRLGDDLMKITLTRLAEMPEEIKAIIREELEGTVTAWYETHPAFPDRARAVDLENAPGIFVMEEPSTNLFGDFDKLSKRLTLQFYRLVLGEKFRPRFLVTSEEIVARSEERSESFDILRRFFQNLLILNDPFFLNPGPLPFPKDKRATFETLKSSRNWILENLEPSKKAVEMIRKANSAFRECQNAEDMIEIRLRVPQNLYSRDLSTLEKVHRVHGKAAKAQREYTPVAERFFEAQAARMTAGLVLIQASECQDRLGDEFEPIRQEIRTLKQFLDDLRPLMTRLHALHLDYSLLGYLIQMYRLYPDHELLRDKLTRCARRVHAAVLSIFQELLTQIDYPFEHAKGKIKLAEFIIDQLPMANDLMGTFRVSSELIDTTIKLYVRAMSRLCTHAERLETLSGLPLLPDPTPEPETPARGSSSEVSDEDE